MSHEGPKPIPDTPTHCRGCGELLPPLRRYAGLCKACVAGMQHPAASQADRFRWTVLERFTKPRPNGIHESYVRVRCECGTKRAMSVSEFEQHRSYGCNRCKLRAIRQRGVESDYAR